MGRVTRYALAGVVTIFTGLVFLGAYARIWENKKPTQKLRDAQILSIEPYSSHNDLHWSAKGYRVRIEGEEKIIDFPFKNWDETVKEKDIADLVVRESFPWFGKKELDGIEINDHK